MHKLKQLGFLLFLISMFGSGYIPVAHAAVVEGQMNSDADEKDSPRIVGAVVSPANCES